MNHLYPILYKVFVREFYRQNVILFILAIAFFGGVMSGREHVALALFLISTPESIVTLFIAWVLYAVKVSAFIAHVLTQPENEFIHHFRLYPRAKQYASLLQCWMALLAPVIAYGLFLLILSVKFRQTVSMTLVLASLSILITTGAAITLYRFQNPFTKKSTSLIKQWINKSFAKPYFVFVAEWIIRRDVITFLLIKAGALVIFVGTFRLYEAEPMDHRLLGMATVTAFALNASFIFEVQHFESVYSSWIKNLPRSTSRRAMSLLLSFVLICLTETTIFIGNIPATVSPWSIPLILSTGFSLLTLIYGVAYIKSFKLDQFIRIVFFITLSEIACILFKVPLSVLTVVNVSTATLLYGRNYYRFEVTEPDKESKKLSF